MESFQLVIAISKPMLWLLPIALLLAFLKSPLFKGWFGEKLVSKKATLRLPGTVYFGYNNVTIPDGTGTTQIDHIYVSQFGIFVVETKNMSGWIFGSADQPQWTQVIFKRKQKFQNPIRQNFKHVRTLQSMLQLPSSKLHTVIVFTGDSTFKTDLPDSVCTLSNFTDHIKSFTDLLLTDAEVATVRSKIEGGRLAENRATHAAHVQHLRRKHRQ